PRPPSSPLFPYTTLFRSHRVSQHGFVAGRDLSRPRGSRPGHFVERRKTDRLTGCHPVTRAGAFAVDADPPGTQQLFEPPMAECRSEEHTSELQSLTNLVC